jgi:hypothetical protein
MLLSSALQFLATWTVSDVGSTVQQTLHIAGKERPLHSSARNIKWRGDAEFVNPVLPGSHPDPSCARAEDKVYYCTAASDKAFPGLPIYASKDLVNWKLISHAWNSDYQLPNNVSRAGAPDVPQGSLKSPTLRYWGNEWILMAQYDGPDDGPMGLIFRTSNPYINTEWSNAVSFTLAGEDPGLFIDSRGVGWTVTHGAYIHETDLRTGATRPGWRMLDHIEPEMARPMLYQSGKHYWLIGTEGANGGREPDAAVVVARARRLRDTFRRVHRNPILTNSGNQGYFQGVGRADLFPSHYRKGTWWAMTSATRSGPPGSADSEHHPMGAETAMTPVYWDMGKMIPRPRQVRGLVDSNAPHLGEDNPQRNPRKEFDWQTARGNGAFMPPMSRRVGGNGPFAQDDDHYDFPPGRPLPRNLMHWGAPSEKAYTIIGPVQPPLWVPGDNTTVEEEGQNPGEPEMTKLFEGQPSDEKLSDSHPVHDMPDEARPPAAEQPGAVGLGIAPSRANLTAPPVLYPRERSLIGTRDLSFLGRLQTSTYFNFSVEAGLYGQPRPELEYGVTVFLDHSRHIDLSVVGTAHALCQKRCLRLSGVSDKEPPIREVMVDVPDHWPDAVVFRITAVDTTRYAFSATTPLPGHPDIALGTVSSIHVSHGVLGAKVGVFSTCNGAGSGVDCPPGGMPVFTKWTYLHTGQIIALQPNVRAERANKMIDKVMDKYN